MDAIDQTPIDNDEGLESFASAWANVLIDLNDKPQQSVSSIDESTTAIESATNDTKGDSQCHSTLPAKQT